MNPVASWSRIGVLLGSAVAVFTASLLFGSVDLSFAQLEAALRGSADGVTSTVLFELRLPRVLAAFGVGAALALSGVLLQALFRNPLADPFVIGVSGGAAVGALIAMALGAGWLLTQSAAGLGALLAVLTVAALSARADPARLLLTGVIIAASSGALVMLVLAAARDESLRGMLFWLAGDLSLARYPALTLAGAASAVAGAWLFARPLNVLAAGELRAQSVGLNLVLWRWIVFAAAALMAAVAVVSAGTIGFIGLIAPHLARLLFRTSDHRIVAPAAAALGGTLLAAADLLARTAIEPQQLPVGAVMALLGAPLFLLLLRRS